MELASHARVTIPRPREEVFDYLTDTDAFCTYLLKHGPIAGITRVEMVDGAPVATGNRRLVFMTDGSVLDETIVAYDRPVQHAYRWTETLKPPFAWLVRGGGGHWTFREDEEGTRVDWRYTFEPRSAVLWPVGKALLVLFGRWQRAGLARAKRHLAP
jgi:uncharacterized protein YndB with AHSA1/START domain